MPQFTRNQSEMGDTMDPDDGTTFSNGGLLLTEGGLEAICSSSQFCFNYDAFEGGQVDVPDENCLDQELDMSIPRFDTSDLVFQYILEQTVEGMFQKIYKFYRIASNGNMFEAIGFFTNMRPVTEEFTLRSTGSCYKLNFPYMCDERTKALVKDGLHWLCKSVAGMSTDLLYIDNVPCDKGPQELAWKNIERLIISAKAFVEEIVARVSKGESADICDFEKDFSIEFEFKVDPSISLFQQSLTNGDKHDGIIAWMQFFLFYKMVNSFFKPGKLQPVTYFRNQKAYAEYTDLIKPHLDMQSSFYVDQDAQTITIPSQCAKIALVKETSGVEGFKGRFRVNVKMDWLALQQAVVSVRDGRESMLPWQMVEMNDKTATYIHSFKLVTGDDFAALATVAYSVCDMALDRKISGVSLVL